MSFTQTFKVQVSSSGFEEVSDGHPAIHTVSFMHDGKVRVLNSRIPKVRKHMFENASWLSDIMFQVVGL